MYINDIAPESGELYAAFATTTVGNATIDSIDTAPAMVLKFLMSLKGVGEGGGKQTISRPVSSPLGKIRLT